MSGAVIYISEFQNKLAWKFGISVSEGDASDHNIVKTTRFPVRPTALLHVTPSVLGRDAANGQGALAHLHTQTGRYGQPYSRRTGATPDAVTPTPLLLLRASRKEFGPGPYDCCYRYRYRANTVCVT